MQFIVMNLFYFIEQRNKKRKNKLITHLQIKLIIEIYY